MLTYFHVRPLGRHVNSRLQAARTAAGTAAESGPVGQRGSSLAADDFPKPLKPRGDVAFGAVGGGLVVVAAHQIIRRVLLGGHGMRGVVGVFVARAVAQLFGARVVGVAKVRGDAVARVRRGRRRWPG